MHVPYTSVANPPLSGALAALAANGPECSTARVTISTSDGMAIVDTTIPGGGIGSAVGAELRQACISDRDGHCRSSCRRSGEDDAAGCLGARGAGGAVLGVAGVAVAG